VTNPHPFTRLRLLRCASLPFASLHLFLDPFAPPSLLPTSLTHLGPTVSSPIMPNPKGPRWIRLVACVQALGFVACLVCTTGCLGPKRDVYVTSRPIDMQHGTEQADRLWIATGDVLRNYNFTLDRTDWRDGIITTLPETSRALLEFWRKDVQTDDDLWESTVNPIRRWVEVRFAPDDQGKWKELTVVVHKQRFSSLDRQFNSTGAAYQYFGSDLPTTAGLAEATDAFDQWIDMDEDPALAECLLSQIWQSAGLDADQPGH